MSDKQKYPAARARLVAEKIVEWLKPACTRIEIAGSLRRGKPEVGDIEILYISRPTTIPDPEDMFKERKITVPAADIIIQAFLADGRITKRPKENGTLTWGEWIKLAKATRSGIPVDFFATTETAWFNLLVCRTGSADTNTRIAALAQKKGYRWSPSPDSPYAFAGIRPDRHGERVPVASERDVFEFVGLTYLEPHER